MSAHDAAVVINNANANFNISEELFAFVLLVDANALIDEQRAQQVDCL